MRDGRFSTGQVPAAERAGAWRAAIAASYFPLDLAFPDPARFEGTLALWTLGDVAVSRHRSGPLTYRRRAAHLRMAGEDSFLVTLPQAGPVRFEQRGRSVACGPGAFVIEHGAEPYEFAHDGPCDLFVLKFARAGLERRLRAPARFCALRFDAGTGVGALMAGLVRASEAAAPDMSGAARALAGTQIADLLALAVEGDARAAASGLSSVRAAHLARVRALLRARAGEPGLAAGEVAAAAGLSLRYLHDLLRDTGETFGGHLRAARLEAARAALARPGERRSVAEIALACGFADPSAFARAFRARFGLSPSEARGR